MKYTGLPVYGAGYWPLRGRDSFSFPDENVSLLYFTLLFGGYPHTLAPASTTLSELVPQRLCGARLWAQRHVSRVRILSAVGVASKLAWSIPS